jgi:hypothetical protein
MEYDFSFAYDILRDIYHVTFGSDKFVGVGYRGRIIYSY